MLKKLASLSIITLLAPTLCFAAPAVSTNCHKVRPINPDQVHITRAPETSVDKVIGKIYVDRYNHCGIKRQFGVINDLMKRAAAAVGGTEVVAVHLTKKYAIGKIVTQAS